MLLGIKNRKGGVAGGAGNESTMSIKHEDLQNIWVEKNLLDQKPNGAVEFQGPPKIS